MADASDEILITVAEAVSDALGKPITDLPPLSRSIDLDALDALVNAHPSHTATVSFTYAGLHVFVQSNNTVSVQPLQANRDHPSSNTLFESG